MKGTVTSFVTAGLNIRDVADPSRILGKLYYNTLLRKGDVVYGEVRSDNRLYFSRVYRANGAIEQIAGSAATKEGTSIYLATTNESEPETTPTPTQPVAKPFTITISGDDYQPITVEVKPK